MTILIIQKITNKIIRKMKNNQNTLGTDYMFKTITRAY